MANTDPFSDRTLGTTTDLASTSGNWSMASTTDGHQSLDSIMATGDEKVVTAVGSSGQWECFVTKKLGSNSFSRSGDMISSSTGSVVNFSAGTKELFIGFPFSEISARDKFDYLVNGSGLINDGATSLADGVTGAHRRWHALTQTAAITPSSLSDVADGVESMIRLTQPQASAQRMGFATILRSERVKKLRGKKVSFGGILRYSNAAAVRFAILEWTGTADAVTRDVVNDWTSSTYTAGNFFISSNLTVRAVGSLTPSAATLTDFRLSATLGSTLNNLILFIWTEGTAAQNSTLDFACQLKRGSVVHPCVWRTLAEEGLQVRTVLHTATTFYVRTDGNDNNSGLVDSAAGAFLTLSGAMTAIRRDYDFNGKTHILQVRDGTYSAAPVITVDPWFGGGALSILGNTATPGNCIMSGSGGTDTVRIATTSGANIDPVSINGFDIRAASGRYGINNQGTCHLAIGANMVFGTSTGATAHLAVTWRAAQMHCAGYTINGNADRHIDCDAGIMQYDAAPTISGSLTFGVFARARNHGCLIATPAGPWSGTVSGKRFSCEDNAEIQPNGDRDYFPGTTAGTCSGGGTYGGSNPISNYAPHSVVFAYNSATDADVTGNGGTHTCVFDTEVTDKGGNYNNSTGVFTALITAPHSIGGQVVATQATADTTILVVNAVASNRTTQCGNIQGINSATLTAPFSAPAVDMDAGDTLSIQIVATGMAGNTADFFGDTSPKSHLGIVSVG